VHIVKIVAVASLLVILTVVACGGGDPPETAGIHEGSVAVDFRLPTLDGTEVSLGDYRGNVVLVNFWATWCPPCRAEIPDIEAAYQARQDEGFVVLGVSVEQTQASVAPFVQAMEMTYPVLLDETGQVYRTYRAPGLPMSILVDEEGVIRARHVGGMTRAQLDGYLAEVLP
jgi:cytochrome c biogenesis protein CcmG/thiol:disulfide interchange protein DsbE